MGVVPVSVKGLVFNETVMLRRWRSKAQTFQLIK